MNKHKTNREFKDRLFKALFGSEEQKENILSLYNALFGTNHTNPDDIEITTLKDVIYIKMKNDVSFILYNYLTLMEQQSKFNPNMPLRGFFYHADSYQGFVSRAEIRRQLHTSKLVKIPTPRYIVFYNGDQDMPPVQKLRLSNSFMNKDDSGDFEWTANVYNLNAGKNDELLANCKPLSDYMTLINYVKELKLSGLDNAAAIDGAVDRCISEGILKEFLQKHRAEVIDMLLTEYNEEIIAEGYREEGYDKGVEDGIAKDKAEIALKMKASGFDSDMIEKITGLSTAEIAEL